MLVAAVVLAGLLSVVLWSLPTAPPVSPTAAAPPASRGSADTRRPHLWVLSIGVGQYHDQELRLQYAAADAEAFADAFKRQAGGPLYDTVHCTVLVDAAASREKILETLETFFGAAAPVDVAVIFLAGHGARTDKPTAYYFLTATASPAAPHIAGLDMTELNRQLQRVHRNIPRMLVVLDTCHGGAVTQGADPPPGSVDLAKALAPAEGLYILTAARAGERSFELAPQQHGAFTYALLDGLQGDAANADGLITVLGLASHATSLVQHLTQNQQRPYIAMIGEDLTLAADPRRLATVTPPAMPVRAAHAEAPPQLERVAIRDFEHLGPDASNDWMRKALSQDVLTAFSELHQLDVYDETMLRFVTRDAPDVIDAAQRAGIGMLVEGAYWVQDHQLSVSAQVKSVRPLQLVASARTQGSVDQFSVLTGRLVLDLLKQLPVALPAQLAARLQHPDTTSLAARRLLTESDTASSGGAVPETPGGFVPPGASLLRPLWHLASDWLGGIRLFRPGFAGQALAQAPAPAPAPDIEAELRGTLAAYREALERKDIDGLSAYYETLSPSQRGALMQYFANAEDLHIELSDVRVAIIGDAAAVSFTRQDHFIDRNTGAPQRVNVRITKRFSRGSSGWVIRNEP